MNSKLQRNVQTGDLRQQNDEGQSRGQKTYYAKCSIEDGICPFLLDNLNSKLGFTEKL